jgi:hypothetical protein
MFNPLSQKPYPNAILVKQGDIIVRQFLDGSTNAIKFATNMHNNTKEPYGYNMIVWTVYESGDLLFSTRDN